MTPINTNSDLIPSAAKDDTTVIATIYGEIDMHNSPELRRGLFQLTQQSGLKKLILNLRQVPYMDSSAVAVLVESLQRMRKIGGKIYLTDLQPRVQGLLEIARLGTIFVIAKNQEEAMLA